jgi:hypothetical protein
MTTNANPVTRLLQSLPDKVRLTIYALLFIAGVVYAAVETAGGDWRKAIGILLAGVLGGALPASNVTPNKAAAKKKA